MAKKKNNVININLDNPDDINNFLNKVVQELISGQQGAQPNPANPFVTGFSIKIDKSGVSISDNKQVPNQNGVLTTQAQPPREPLVDIIDRPNGVSVIAEIPGIKKSNIEVTSNGSNLKIVANEKDRSYNKAIALPHSINPHTASAVYNNGILEINLDKGEYSGKLVNIKIK
ncbi:MAG: Hsp20/alpha crystallin family protein [Candidatus Micrarchaeota archaeon]|nr:Hsp20/alpha crystallin family protein [Candidatus Micrarchaeota archaeon]